MSVRGNKQLEQWGKQSTINADTNISMSKSKELAKMSNQIIIVDFNPLFLIVATTMAMVLDDYGFIILNDSDLKKHKHPKRALFRKIATGGGRYNCKGLCRPFPKKDSRSVSFRKTGEYFCATCEIAMKCCRCHCCGRQGRVEPRGRHGRLDKKGVKFVE